MSGVCLNWAWQQAVERAMPKSRAFIYVCIADAAQRDHTTRIKKATIAARTRSDPKTVFTEVACLIADGLLERTKLGRSWLFKVLGPQPNGEDHISGVAPDIKAGVTPGVTVDKASTKRVSGPHKDKRKRVSHPANRVSHPVISGVTPPKTTSNQESDLKTREAAARNDAAAAAAPDGRSGDDAAPLVPPKAPALGTTTAGVPANALRPPGATNDDFRDWLDRGAPARLTTDAPDTLTEDDTPRTEADRAHMAAQLANLAASLASNYQNNYPPRAASMSADDQTATLAEKTRPRAYHLAGDHLAAERARLRAKVPA